MPLVPVTVLLDVAGRFTLVEPSQIFSSLFVSEATPDAPYFVQIGQAEPSGPYAGRALSIRMGDSPLRERQAGCYCVVKSPQPNGRVVFQIAYSTNG